MKPEKSTRKLRRLFLFIPKKLQPSVTFLLHYVIIHMLLIWVIDQAWGRMAGYWPSSFIWLFMGRDRVSVHKLAKKERGQYPPILTEKAWSIKDLLNFSRGTRRVVPSGQDNPVFPARVANHSQSKIRAVRLCAYFACFFYPSVGGVQMAR